MNIGFVDNMGFVYKGVLVLFDEKIGYFIYVDGCRISNNDKQKILDFIDKTKLIKGIFVY